MAKGLIILGTRMLAEEMFDLISEIKDYEVAAFVENMDRSLVGTEIEGRPVVWIDDAVKYARTHAAICALSTTHRRKYVEQAEGLGLKLATVVHPLARVSSRATLAPGCFVSAMCIVSTKTKLGKSVFMNRAATVGHHTTIGDYCTIQPGATVAGAIQLGEDTYVGMRATVIERLKIGRGAVIAAGAVVVEDVPERVMVMGVPAKVVKRDIEAK